MEPGTLFILLLVLACPLLMVLMMRGHGGHRSHGLRGRAHRHGATVDEPATDSLMELRRRRDTLDAEIDRLERSETATPTGVGGG